MPTSAVLGGSPKLLLLFAEMYSSAVD
jgi:hypothetical protein